MLKFNPTSSSYETDPNSHNPPSSPMTLDNVQLSVIFLEKTLEAIKKTMIGMSMALKKEIPSITTDGR